MPNNIQERYIPGKMIEVPDFGSRYPFSEFNHELFVTEVGRPGICIRSRRVMSLDVKDPKIEVLAKIGTEDAAYLRDIDYM